jgi:hypothetical protein
MKGWKTWAAAIGAFATGISMIIAGVSGDAIDPNKIWEGILVCAGALATVGIGHKIEKLGGK